MIITLRKKKRYGKYFLSTEAPGDDEMEVVSDEEQAADPVPKANTKVITIKPRRSNIDFADGVEDEEENPYTNTDPTNPDGVGADPTNPDGVATDPTNPDGVAEPTNTFNDPTNPDAVGEADPTNPDNVSTDPTNPDGVATDPTNPDGVGGADPTNPDGVENNVPADPTNPDAVGDTAPADPTNPDGVGGGDPTNPDGTGGDNQYLTAGNDPTNPDGAGADPSNPDAGGGDPSNPDAGGGDNPDTSGDSEDFSDGTDAGGEDSGGGDTSGTSNDSKSGPGLEYDSTRKYNLFKNFMSLLNLIDNYISKLEGFMNDNHEMNKVLKIVIEKLREIRDLTYDYVMMRFEISSYVQSLVFYQNQVVTIQLAFNLLEKGQKILKTNEKK